MQNPTKSELLNGVYKPRLTLTKQFNCSGRFEQTLSIELSLPKLLYKNNFDELQSSDFTRITELLNSVLKTMGVRIFNRILVTAPVTSIHYSKNIPLTDGSTPHYLISKIKEANTSLALDVNQTDYFNGGHGYKWHTSSYEVAFYDKVRDLEKAEKQGDKRAIEKDNAIQLNLFDTFQKRRQLEVLRMEVRLNNRQKIRQLFQTLNITPDLTFQSLFSLKISQKVLLHYLDEVERQRPIILNYKPASPKDLLASLIIGNPKLGVRQILQLHDLKQLLETMTFHELRSMFRKYSDRTWQRLIADIKKVNLPKSKSPFALLRENLTNFEPLRLVDFQDQMINNDKYN